MPWFRITFGLDRREYWRIDVKARSLPAAEKKATRLVVDTNAGYPDLSFESSGDGGEYELIPEMTEEIADGDA